MNRTSVFFVQACWAVFLLAAGAAQDAAAASSLPVKMSITGVCYDPAVTSERPFLATGHFATMAECLKAKGRAAAADGGGASKAGADMPAPASAANAPTVAAAATKPAEPARPAAVVKRQDRALYDSDDAALVKRGADDVCRDGRDSQFGQLLHFRVYRTLQDCLDSGGRR